MVPPIIATTEDQLKFVMHIIKSCEAMKPNYHQVATDCGIVNANNAQKRFKKIVEQAGFNLVNGAVVDAHGAETASPATDSAPITPKKRGRTKKDTPSKKHQTEPIQAEVEPVQAGVKKHLATVEGANADDG